MFGISSFFVQSKKIITLHENRVKNASSYFIFQFSVDVIISLAATHRSTEKVLCEKAGCYFWPFS